ncbi:hypothetical protein ANN_06330 [Periplaneta americana]|uniref:Uncharacterized protein n=1 Tax=Periplaneta americana TaxID=6978 RepID=A0ABQ8TD99_PERAM|nr:hypothetical protein ANN_06330 [Periplaneta americana]
MKRASSFAKVDIRFRSFKANVDKRQLHYKQNRIRYIRRLDSILYLDQQLLVIYRVDEMKRHRSCRKLSESPSFTTIQNNRTAYYYRFVGKLFMSLSYRILLLRFDDEQRHLLLRIGFTQTQCINYLDPDMTKGEEGRADWQHRQCSLKCWQTKKHMLGYSTSAQMRATCTYLEREASGVSVLKHAADCWYASAVDRSKSVLREQVHIVFGFRRVRKYNTVSSEQGSRPSFTVYSTYQVDLNKTNCRSRSLCSLHLSFESRLVILVRFASRLVILVRFESRSSFSKYHSVGVERFSNFE